MWKDLNEVGFEWVDWMRLGLAVSTGFLKTVMNPPVPLSALIFVAVKRLKRKTLLVEFTGSTQKSRCSP
jgi:hypothetical protein